MHPGYYELRKKYLLKKACHPEPKAKDRIVLAHYDPSVASLPQDDRRTERLLQEDGKNDFHSG